MTEGLPPAPAPGQLPDYGDRDLLVLEPGDMWARIFFYAGRHPTRWDRFRTMALAKPGRFDAFGAPQFDGVAYGAVPKGPLPAWLPPGPLAPGACSALATCMAELAQETHTLDRLDMRALAVAELTRPVQLLDVSSDWATRAGAGVHLSAASKVHTSRWARAIATRWPDLAGVAYISSTRPAGRAVAWWAPRASEAVATSTLQLHRSLDDPVLGEALVWAAHATGTILLRHP